MYKSTIATLAFLLGGASPSFAQIVKSMNSSDALTAKSPAQPVARRARAPRPRPHLDVKHMGDWRAVYDETKNLLIPDQKYLIQYEEEDAYGTMGLASGDSGNVTTVFSSGDVDQYKRSVEALTAYRAELVRHCSTPSSHAFGQALDKYALSLISFHRRALPIVGDISENNNVLVLLVNRTALRDATVLVSRYLQFKKQRFKDSMGRFLAGDNKLVAEMVNIGKQLKVELTDDDWNRAYGLRESSLEMISLWPRDTIYEASTKLGDARETACVVSTDTMTGKKAETKIATAPETAPAPIVTNPAPGKSTAVDRKPAE